MRDESYDRDNRFAREARLARGQAGAELWFIGHAIDATFATLTRIRFDAPWRRSANFPRVGETCG